MKVLSVYSGGGGIDKGLKQSGIKTTLAIDHYQFCIKTMKLNHECEGIVAKVGDMIESLGKFDIIVGGPPCPEFSNANPNRTHDATEVNVFWEIIQKVKPKYWLMENVPGVIKVCKKRNFLINCADYGTPQTRIRRFFTNLLKPKKTHSQFPSNDLFGDKIQKWVNVKDVLSFEGMILDKTIPNWKKKVLLQNTDKPYRTILVDKSCNGIWFVSPTGFDKRNEKEFSRSVDNPIQTIVVAGDYRITDKPVYSKKYIQYKQNWKEIRKLTLEELKILQGFPINYKFYGNSQQIKYQIGNAVPSHPVKALFSQVSN